MIQSNNNLGSTQPSKPAAKPQRGRRFLLNALILIALLGLGIFSGYQSALSIRRNAESSTMMEQLGEQFQYALVDMQFGRYEIARQRLEFIIEKDPDFPGVQEKLTEVLVQINLQQNYVAPTIAVAEPTLTPLPDFNGAEEAFVQAQQLIAAQDWSGALAALDQSRKLDPAYNTSQVDGMYYFALRNNGYDLITKQGNLEGGIYYLTLAERFGTLDNTAVGLREGARYYLLGASFWDLDWEQAVYYFTQVYSGWPSLWDGTLTAADRFRLASMNYGDQLFSQKRYCDAFTQYDNASKLGTMDEGTDARFQEAKLNCYPPTLTPTATLEVTPTETLPAPLPTDTATATP